MTLNYFLFFFFKLRRKISIRTRRSIKKKEKNKQLKITLIYWQKIMGKTVSDVRKVIDFGFVCLVFFSLRSLGRTLGPAGCFSLGTFVRGVWEFCIFLFIPRWRRLLLRLPNGRHLHFFFPLPNSPKSQAWSPPHSSMCLCNSASVLQFFEHLVQIFSGAIAFFALIVGVLRPGKNKCL